MMLASVSRATIVRLKTMTSSSILAQLVTSVTQLQAFKAKLPAQLAGISPTPLKIGVWSALLVTIALEQPL